MTARTSRFRFALVAVAAAASTAVGAGAARTAPGDIYNLGVFEGGERSESHRVNNAGQVTGSVVPFSGAPTYFRYSGIPGAGGVMEDLTSMGGGTYFGSGINDAGQVTGKITRNGNPGHVVRYSGAPGTAGTPEDLGVPPGSTSGLGV